MAQAGLEARGAAVAAMTAVTGEGRMLSDALPRLTADLAPGDRARAGRLASEALRWAQRSDRVLGPHLRNKPEDPVMNALRLSLYEMFEEGAPPHAAVDAAVTLVSRSKSGLVNAVLRNVLRRDIDWPGLPIPQAPKWLRKRLISAWGKEVTVALEAVHATSAPLDLTLRDPSKAETWAGKLGADVLPTGNLRLAGAGQVSKLPGYDEGAWWVQDAGATLAAMLLDVTPGAHVLDLCAAPGGKTMQLAAAGAKVTALDNSEARLARLHDNLARTGLSADVVVADAIKWEPGTLFDAILLDAPCSATGTLRRHPDLAYARDGTGIDTLVALQSALLERATGWLKPGGRLVYCTCSLLPEEGEAQIEAVLDRLPLSLVLPEAPWIDPIWPGPYGLRIRPDHWASRGGIDGFFVACLEKRP